MPEIISDDIGSFPLPEGVEKEKIRRIAGAVASKKADKEDTDLFNKTVSELMKKKIASGIMRPNYPQIQDMVSSFDSLIKEFPEKESPFIIQEGYAVISEVLGIEEAAKEYYKDSGRPLMLRACATGPLELYLKGIGANVQADLLKNVGKSVARFFSNSMINKPYLKTALFSIDEPGLGLNPSMYVKDEDLIEAFEAATKPLKRCDVEIHLHSSNAFDVICQTTGINVIGIEYAENPKALDWIGRSELDSYDKSIRLGVSRTNIAALASGYHERFGQDIWKTKEFSLIPERMETPRNIGKRLEKAYSDFNERIRYAGPDCGLGSWPSQGSAELLLKNTADGINLFNQSH